MSCGVNVAAPVALSTCTPYEYQTGKFIGQKPRYKEFFGLGNWVSADFKGMNKRNLYYPTTIMDLGPRDEFAKEICNR